MQEIGDTFKIILQQEGEKRFLIFTPETKCEGYPDKKIEVTSEQFDLLRWHFITAVHDKKNVQKLAYV